MCELVSSRGVREGRIAAGTNQRAVGTNPTALGTNPRAMGLNPRALGTNPRAAGTNPNAGKSELTGQWRQKAARDAARELGHWPTDSVRRVLTEPSARALRRREYLRQRQRERKPDSIGFVRLGDAIQTPPVGGYPQFTG